MSTILFLRGSQIGTFTGLSATGNADDRSVTLSGVQALGSDEEIFRVELRQVSEGQQEFRNGQFVDIYDANDQLVYASLVPRHDEHDGRASSTGHQIFSDGNVVFIVDGVEPDADGQITFGPGPEPDRATQLPFASFPTEPPCFVAGTCIATPSGERAVETLEVGDLVLTMDAGPQPLRWVGRTQVTGRGAFAPVEIAPRTFGNHRRLRVSPQHRILLRDAWVELAFGAREVLAPAAGLVDGRRVRRAPAAVVEYVHLLFDRHQIVFADGAPAESLFPGDHLLARDAWAAEEILTLFPELHTRRGRLAYPAARRVLSVAEARVVTALTPRRRAAPALA